MWRWSHSGRVCSGDFLESYDDAPTDVYLVFEGRFIKAILISIYSILGLSLISICIVSICVYKRHAEEDRARAEEDRKTGSISENRISAFNKALDPDYEAAMRESARSEMGKKRPFTFD